MISRLCLAVGAFFMVLATVWLFLSREPSSLMDDPSVGELMKLSEEAYRIIRAEKVRLGLDITSHPSGMVGPDYSAVTTTLGSRESKTTSIDSAFSIPVLLYLEQLGLEKGDRIALHFSGSFPAANIKVILAAEILGLEPVIISSVGSSTYGANDPELTYPDMERLLFEKGLISHWSLYVSPGGDGDRGSNMDNKILNDILDRQEAGGALILREPDYGRNLAFRLDVFGQCRALVNVGGNYISQTGPDLGRSVPHGYLEADRLRNYDNRGLIGAFLASGRDVIQILDIKSIALEYSLPIDGQGKNPVSYEYSPLPAFFSAAFFLLTMAGYYYGRQKEIGKNLDKAVQKEFMDSP